MHACIRYAQTAYGTPLPDPGPCVIGDYDDVDDLVVLVKAAPVLTGRCSSRCLHIADGAEVAEV